MPTWPEFRTPEFLTQASEREIRLTGHRIGLYSVVRLHDDGFPPEAIAEELPTLAPELIRRVIKPCAATDYHKLVTELERK